MPVPLMNGQGINSFAFIASVISQGGWHVIKLWLRKNIGKTFHVLIMAMICLKVLITVEPVLSAVPVHAVTNLRNNLTIWLH